MACEGLPIPGGCDGVGLMKLKIGLLALFGGVATWALFVRAASKPREQSEIYYAKQEKIIEAHAATLRKEGRMPLDFSDAFRVIGQYGWHSACGDGVGAVAQVWIYRCDGGSFGAYTFYEPAFAQAKRTWWIHGVMEKGSDLLHPMNRGAKFDESIIGYGVSFMYKGPEGARVIELPKYSDGSSMNVLRLDKKSPDFAQQWDMAITPPDYVDMCSCTITTSTNTADTVKAEDVSK